MPTSFTLDHMRARARGGSDRRVEVLFSELAIRPVYRCCDCGAQALGERHTVRTDGPPPDLRTLPRLPQHMPVGWASYGRSVYRCPTHAR